MSLKSFTPTASLYRLMFLSLPLSRTISREQHAHFWARSWSSWYCGISYHDHRFHSVACVYDSALAIFTIILRFSLFTSGWLLSYCVIAGVVFVCVPCFFCLSLFAFFTPMICIFNLLLSLIILFILVFLFYSIFYQNIPPAPYTPSGCSVYLSCLV